MNHPYKRFVHLQILMLVITLVLGFAAIFIGNLLLLVISLITLAFSFACEGAVEWKKKNTLLFTQQMIRAVVLVTFVLSLYFILT